MEKVLEIIREVKSEFRVQLSKLTESEGLTKDRYQRYLSMQYHLTNGVQKHFFAAAAHPSMVSRKSLRKFLLNFGDEEETHYMIAKKDLESLNLEVLPANLDVELWWSFFDKRVSERPFLRLGATCILENIGVGQSDLIGKLTGRATYLNTRNTRFLTIHQHEDLPHGDQILEALGSVDFTREEMKDLEQGAAIGRVLYLRLFHWVITGKDVV
jgi:hypothetical protein